MNFRLLTSLLTFPCPASLVPYIERQFDTEQEPFLANIGHLDDLLSDESFHSFRNLRIRAKFPKLKARKVEVDQ